MISNALDIGRWRADLRARGRVQIPDYLQADAAERLAACLQHEVPWTLAIRDEQGARTIPAAEYGLLEGEMLAALLQRTALSARGGAYRFAYDSYMMIRAYKEGRDPGLVLHRVLEFFNAPDYLAFMRALTGDDGIRRVSAQATRYRPGHFLRHHNDSDEDEGRRYAYVINLSHDWQADWGGLLQFIGGHGEVQETFLPRWNSLSLFRVPVGHAVSLVSPWADRERLAITGWLLS